MIVKMLEVGPLMVNCYIDADEQTKETVVFDPVQIPQVDLFGWR